MCDYNEGFITARSERLRRKKSGQQIFILFGKLELYLRTYLEIGARHPQMRSEGPRDDLERVQGFVYISFKSCAQFFGTSVVGQMCIILKTQSIFGGNNLG